MKYLLVLMATMGFASAGKDAAEETIRKANELIRGLKPSCYDRCIKWMPEVKKVALKEIAEQKRRPPRKENDPQVQHNIDEIRRVLEKDCGVKGISMVDDMNGCDKYLQLESKYYLMEDQRRTVPEICQFVCLTVKN